jgi:hypothetical protein
VVVLSPPELITVDGRPHVLVFDDEAGEEVVPLPGPPAADDLDLLGQVMAVLSARPLEFPLVRDILWMVAEFEAVLSIRGNEYEYSKLAPILERRHDGRIESNGGPAGGDLRANDRRPTATGSG